MVLSVNDRQRRWREKQAEKGNRAVMVSMDQEAYNALQTIKKETGLNYSEIVNRAVLSGIPGCDENKSVSGEAGLPRRLSDRDTNIVQRFEGKHTGRGKTRSQIMIAALRLFAERGYNATSVEDIIGDVGIARRTFYLHFKGKQEILSLIIDKYNQMFTENVDVIGQLLSRKSQDEMKSIVSNGLQKILSDQELRWFTKLSIGELIGLQGSISASVDNAAEEIIRRISEAIVSAQKDGTVTERVKPLVAAFCLFGGFKEIVFQQIVYGRNFDMAESISHAVDLFASGLFK